MLNCIIIFFTLSAIVYAQNFKGRIEKLSISKPEKVLKVGEVLEYSIEWLGIPIGKIVLEIQGITTVNNYECYHITAATTLNKFFQHLYDVEYEVHTYLDRQLYYARRFEKTRRMNKQSSRIVIDFDQEKRKAVFSSEGSAPLLKISPERNKIETNMPVTAEIPYGTQDLLSCFYYLRLLDIRENNSYPVNIYYNRRNWLVDVKVDKPFLKEIRKKGSFPAIKISLYSKLNNYILGSRKLIVYLTADSRRIPLGFEFKTALGSIYGRIKNLPR